MSENSNRIARIRQEISELKISGEQPHRTAWLENLLKNLERETTAEKGGDE